MLVLLLCACCLIHDANTVLCSIATVSNMMHLLAIGYGRASFLDSDEVNVNIDVESCTSTRRNINSKGSKIKRRKRGYSSLGRFKRHGTYQKKVTRNSDSVLNQENSANIAAQEKACEEQSLLRRK